MIQQITGSANGRALSGLGFASSGFRPMLGVTSSDFLNFITDAGDVYAGLKEAEAQEAAAEAAEAQAEALVAAEKLRLEQERLRQAAELQASKDDLIPGVPNLVTFIGGATLVAGIAWGYFGK